MFASQIQHDSATFKHTDGLTVNVMIDNGWHTIVRADREKLRGKLITGSYVDWNEVVVKAKFFEQD